MDMKESHEAGTNAIIKEAEEIDWVQALFGTGIGSAQQLFEAQMRAYLDASGMVMVPREPNEDMLGAGYNVGCNNETYEIYDVMIRSAPNPFQTPEESREKK